MLDFLASAAGKILAFLLSLTSTGIIALSDPPAPPVIPATPDTKTQEITVLSFNVWAPGSDSMDVRLEGVLETIRKAAPDSFGLQEANEQWRIQTWWNLRGEYGVACFKGRYWGFNEGTPIFYKKDKYKLLEQGTFWLSDNPGTTSVGWDASMPRVAGYAVLQDKETGFTYVHFNTHFDHVGEIARANSARQIADKINELNLPAVLTGDMNARPGTQPTQYLEAGGLLDLRSAAPGADTGSTFHDYKDGTRILDYIYANHYMRDTASARFWVIRDKYNDMYPSDHFAIAATLTLAN